MTVYFSFITEFLILVPNLCPAPAEIFWQYLYESSFNESLDRGRITAACSFLIFPLVGSIKYFSCFVLSPSGLCSGPRWRCRLTGYCWTWGRQTLQDRSPPWVHQKKTEKFRKVNFQLHFCQIDALIYWMGGELPGEKLSLTWRSDCSGVWRRDRLPYQQTSSSPAFVPPVEH